MPLFDNAYATEDTDPPPSTESGAAHWVDERRNEAVAWAEHIASRATARPVLANPSAVPPSPVQTWTGEDIRRWRAWTGNNTGRETEPVDEGGPDYYTWRRSSAGSVAFYDEIQREAHEEEEEEVDEEEVDEWDELPEDDDDEVTFPPIPPPQIVCSGATELYARYVDHLIENRADHKTRVYLQGYVCPMSFECVRDPVMAGGHLYERSWWKKAVEKHRQVYGHTKYMRNPVTGEELRNTAHMRVPWVRQQLQKWVLAHLQLDEPSAFVEMRGRLKIPNTEDLERRKVLKPAVPPPLPPSAEERDGAPLTPAERAQFRMMMEQEQQEMEAEAEQDDAETLRPLAPLPTVVDAMDLDTDPQSPTGVVPRPTVNGLLNAPRASPRAVSRVERAVARVDSRDQAEHVGAQRQLFRDRSTRFLHALNAPPGVSYSFGSQIMVTRLEQLSVNESNNNSNTPTNIYDTAPERYHEPIN